MLTVYKKVEKNTNFLTGIDNKVNGLDADRPFLFSIGANSQNNFELLQKSLLLARVQNKEDSKALFRLDSFHADFLSMAYEKTDNENDIVTELVSKYFFPYLTAKGNDVENIKKQARKMNFLVFSTAGHKIITCVENMLFTSFKNIGLTDEDIYELFSQISLTCVGASVMHYKNKLNSVYFVDVDDKKTTLNTDYLKKRIDQEEQKDNVFGGLENNHIFIFNGNGQNTIENYFNRDGNSFGGLSYIVSYFLDNSIAEKTYISTTGISNILRNGKESSNYSIEALNTCLFYSGAKKHTEDSLRLRKELDDACDQIVMQSQARVSDETVNFLLNEIQSRCSSTVYYQICARLGLIKNPNENIMKQKTDKQLIMGIQQLFGMIPTENDINKTKQKKEGE